MVTASAPAHEEAPLAETVAAAAPVTAQTSASFPLADACAAQQLLDNRLRTLISNYASAPVRATLALLQLANFYELVRWVGASEARQLLADISQLLRESLPAGALLCRCANHEFAVLLEGDLSAHSTAIARQLKSALQSTTSAALPQNLRLQCAVGMASLGKHTPLPEVLYARARHSLGRNSAQPVLDERQSLATARKILRGLRANQLRLSFQPLVPLSVGLPRSYEVRSYLETGSGKLSGQRLYAVAVDNALGESLDRWVVRACLAQLQRAALAGTTLVVNISLTTIVSGRFPDWLRRLLQSGAHPGTRLMLQVSELDLLVAQHHLRSFSIALKSLGIPLAIAHVGCSKDPLRYLSLLRARQAKLDASLLSNLTANSRQMESLTQLVTALHERQIRVAVGQLQNLQLLPLLWQAGLDQVQGKALQPPATLPARHCVTDLVFSS